VAEQICLNAKCQGSSFNPGAPYLHNATPQHFARTVKSARLLIAHGTEVKAPDKYGKAAPQCWVDAWLSSPLRRLAAPLGVRTEGRPCCQIHAG
jgi:hypothetical protein